MTSVACGLLGGVFVAFSTFVMAGLARLRPAEGIRAMQAVNVTAVTPVFMGLFVGGSALAAVTGVAAVLRQDWTAVAGAAVEVVGCFAVTAAVNVPLNNRLAGLDAAEESAAEQWSGYLVGWRRWNHVRAAAGAASCALLVLALLSA